MGEKRKHKYSVIPKQNVALNGHTADTIAYRDQVQLPEKRIIILALSLFRPSGFIISDMGFQSASRAPSAEG